MPPRYVIVDLDGGTDDAWALAMLLKAEKTHNVQVLGITTVAGSTSVSNGLTNIGRVLEVFDRTDIPVFRGAEKAFIEMGPPESIPRHGVDGFGDLEWPTQPDLSFVHEERASSALRRLVAKHPKQVTLLCCGPLTNVALAIKLYPEFGENIKEIHIRGGNYMGVGNVVTRCAEFNFFVDTDAAHIVLNSLKCPMTLVPFEAMLVDNINIELSWRLDVVAAIDHPFVHLMNPIEQKIFAERGFRTWPIDDALLIAGWLFPETVIRERAMRHCDVELHGRDTRGMVVVDHAGELVPNVSVIELLHADGAKDALLWTVTPVTEASVVLIKP